MELDNAIDTILALKQDSIKHMISEDLRTQFKKEVGIDWENSQGEPDLEYVWWLERMVIDGRNDYN